MDLAGIVPIVVTPFDRDDQVDVPSLHRLVEDYCANGVAAIVVPAVASEVDKLTPAEQRLLVRETLAAVRGRLPVIGGVVAASGQEAARQAEAALQAGAVGILCRAPNALLVDAAALQEYLVTVAATGAPYLVLQDLSWDNFGLPLALILELFGKIDAFQAIKIEVVTTGYKASRLLAATGGQLKIWSGWAMLQMIEALDRGVRTFNPSAYHRPFVRVCERYASGDRTGAVRAFEQVLPYLAWSRQHIDINLHLLKRYCQRRGVFQTHALRPPALDFDDCHQRYGAELIERMVAWEAAEG
jgi:4-hydroxy-tetrahydrodipicolinate synthase